MADALTNLPPARAPARLVLEGHYVRLEPLTVAHAPSLFAAIATPSQTQRFEFLFEEPPADEAALRRWIEGRERLADPLFSAVVERSTGRALGRQALMRITPEHGVIEIGSILWSESMARSRLATEALYLAARHVFEDLGYRRFEWKCNALNEPSRRAALRFGFEFEGLFRQHMWLKGRNRDTAWYAMLDRDWAALRAAFERWLRPENFDAGGRQREPLGASVSRGAPTPVL